MVVHAGIHVEDIKSGLRKKHGSIERLAQSWGFDKTAIAKALRNPWPSVQELVSIELGHMPQHIWPDRYDRMGVPLSHSHAKQSIALSALEKDDFVLAA